MATVTEDLAANHVLIDVNGGSTITRVFRVTGLVGLPHAQLIEALRDPAIPDIGDTYPNEPTLFARQHEVRPDGPNAARIEVLYAVANANRGGSWNQPYPGAGNDGDDVKQVSSSIRQVQTNRDVGDNPMTLNPPTSKTLSQAYLSEATTFVPVGTLVFERVETSPPAARLRSLVGKLNSTALGSYAVRTLLFAGFDAQSQDGGRTWQTVYEFQYQSAGWDHTDSWKDEGSRAPTDATRQSWQVIPQADFSGLSLNFADTQTPL